MNRKFVSRSNRVLHIILNSEENVDILEDLIKTFLQIDIKEIWLNPYLKDKANYLPSEENFGIANVRVMLNNKEKEEVNIGLQFIDGEFVQNKMLLYYAQIHTNQLEYPQHKTKARTITINFMDFNYLNDKNYINKITVPSTTEGEIEMYVVELPKFNIKSSENISKRDAWMAYLCGMTSIFGDKEIFKFKMIKKLDKLLNDYWNGEVME